MELKKGNPQEKTYYTITEVSSMVDVKPYILRYWEKEFRELSPYKDPGRTRRYRKKDIETILKIRQLVYEKKHTVKGAKEILRSGAGNQEASQSDTDSIQLEKIKHELLELKETLKKYK